MGHQDVESLSVWDTGDVVTMQDGSATAVDEVQTIKLSFTTYSYIGEPDTQTTENIAFNASANEVQTALLGLSNVGSNDVTVSGNSGGPFTVTFVNYLGSQNVSLLTADTSQLFSTLLSIHTTTHGALGANEVQSVGYTASTSSVSGTFQLTHDGATTGDLAWNASAATVQAALAALSTVGSGNVLVTKTADTATQQTWRLTFVAGRGAQDVPQTTIDTANVVVTSGSATPSAATDTAGFGSANEVQQVALNNAQSGTFTLTLAGQTTAAIAHDASAVTVKAALEALSNLDNVAVSGSAGGPYTITFGGSASGTDLAQLTSNTSNLTYVSRVFQYTYDAAGNLLTATDNDSAYAYVYDGLGRATSVDNNGTPGVPRVILQNQFDTLGRRTQLAASVGGTADFLNAYAYDALSRMTHVEQRGQSGGNSVADKGVNFAYNALGQFTSIVRYTDLVNGPVTDVATSAFTYDSLSRLTSLTHSHASTPVAGYSWTYDALSRVTHMESLLDDGESDYTYDATSQLVAADHDFQADEAYSFDANGNRNGTGQTVGAGNRPITDGVFNFTYDSEGNLIARQRVSNDPADDYRTEYGWDHRNRLTRVTFKDNAGAVTKLVETVYDVFDRRIGKRVDTDGDGHFDRYERFVYDGDDVVLDFLDPDGEGTDPLVLATRYLHGPSVDQILAQEDVATNDVLWQLTDNLGSVRDLVDSSGDLVAHYVYDSFGNLVSGADGQTRYLYTGREWDADIGLQYNRARWYDPALGRWLSEDPIGFAAGDANVRRYVGNHPTWSNDPTGLIEPTMVPSPGFGGGMNNPMTGQSLTHLNGQGASHRPTDVLQQIAIRIALNDAFARLAKARMWQIILAEARKRGVPTYLIEQVMNSPNGSVTIKRRSYNGSPASFIPDSSGNGGTVCLAPGLYDRVHDNTINNTDLGVIYNELFHAYMAIYVYSEGADNWVLRIMEEEGYAVPRNDKKVALSEEAMSSMIDRLVQELGRMPEGADGLPIVPRPAPLIDYRFGVMAPEHADPGQAFASLRNVSQKVNKSGPKGPNDEPSMQLYLLSVYMLSHGRELPDNIRDADVARYLEDQFRAFKRHFKCDY